MSLTEHGEKYGEKYYGLDGQQSEADAAAQGASPSSAALADNCATANDDEPEQDKVPRRSVASQLVDMARNDYRLGISDTEEPFGVRSDRPHIARMLRGGKTGLRAELAQRYFNENGAAASQQALGDACMVLEGYAAQEHPTQVHLRVARHAGVVYIDMGDAEGRIIKMNNQKWSITSTGVPVLFRRTKLTGAYDEPQPGGNLAKLREFVPINDESWPLLVAWLVSALITPDVAHTILALIAEHGSAKSTITRCLVDLIDPSPVPLRQAPRDQHAWTTAASASWIVALDNMSGVLPNWLSDCLCRAATGDGDVRRALYTDNDVSVLSFRRAVIFNGVDLQVTQGDLADRLLRIDLQRIEHRLTDEELTSKWHHARPVILGGLLDLAAKVHNRLGSTVVHDPPRMADFARVLAAVDAVLNTNGLAHYRQQRRRLAADTLDNPFTAALIQKNLTVENKTSAEVLAALIPTDAENAPKDWPKNTRAVTAQLTRDAPALREQGWQIDNDGGRNKDGIIKWIIRAPKKVCNPDPPSPPNPPSQVNGQKLGGSEYFVNPPSPPNPPKTGALSWEDGEAGQAGQDYGQSQDVAS